MLFRSTYATRHGWSVADEHIYVDDGISGAEFERRPAPPRLLNALKPRPPFQALLITDRDRIGREQIETGYILKQVIRAGVQVIECKGADGHEITLGSPTDKVIMAVEDFAAEVEREKARQRTHDALLRKARAGQVPGGRVYGYDNRDVVQHGGDGRRVRSHVERAINPAQAAVVRRIFELCAQGFGVKRIAHTLNADGASAPIPGRPGRPRGWAPSSVREILYRPLYRGEIVWNRTRRRDAWGVKHQSDRPPDDWVRVSAPHLRIVSDDLRHAAHARLTASQASYLQGTGGARWERPPSGIASKCLLTGFACCAGCGGSLHVRSRSHGAHRAYFYGCQTYHLRGPAICANRLEAPLEATNTPSSTRSPTTCSRRRWSRRPWRWPFVTSARPSRSSRMSGARWRPSSRESRLNSTVSSTPWPRAANSIDYSMPSACGRRAGRSSDGVSPPLRVAARRSALTTRGFVGLSSRASPTGAGF